MSRVQALFALTVIFLAQACFAQDLHTVAQELLPGLGAPNAPGEVLFSEDWGRGQWHDHWSPSVGWTVVRNPEGKGYCAQVVSSSRYQNLSSDAVVYLVDVYRGRGLAGVERGTVQALRVIAFDLRDTPETGGLRQENGPSGGHSCPVSALGGSWHVKRILGTVPVYEDGSALFRIPAENRVFFQPLDEHGRALQSMRSWVEPMPGETVSCVGCHESPAETPPALRTIALGKGPVEPTPWYGPPRTFGFPREVQPVLDRYCTDCHNQRDENGLDLRGDATNWFSLAYENLRPFVKPIGPQGGADMPPPRAQGAIASPLVNMLLEGHEDIRLDPESLDRIITWIDLNIPY
jgi:hypothetical protein